MALEKEKDGSQIIKAGQPVIMMQLKPLQMNWKYRPLILQSTFFAPPSNDKNLNTTNLNDTKTNNVNNRKVINKDTTNSNETNNTDDINTTNATNIMPAKDIEKTDDEGDNPIYKVVVSRVSLSLIV